MIFNEQKDSLGLASETFIMLLQFVMTDHDWRNAKKPLISLNRKVVGLAKYAFEGANGFVVGYDRSIRRTTTFLLWNKCLAF